MQHTRLPCPSLSPRVCSNSCPLSWWCHPIISSSVVPFCCPQSFPASESFAMSQLLASGGQSIGASASVLPILVFVIFLGHLMPRADSLQKTLMLGRTGGRRRRGWQKMRWMASPTQWTWVWVNSRSWQWEGGLACYSLWGCKELGTTEQLNWTEHLFSPRVWELAGLSLWLWLSLLKIAGICWLFADLPWFPV